LPYAADIAAGGAIGEGQRVRTRTERLTEPVDFLALCAAWPERYVGLLETVAVGAQAGGFDLLLVSNGEALVCADDGSLHGPHAAGAGGFLEALEAWTQSLAGRATAVSALAAEAQAPELPFAGGWLLALGYELAGEIEPRLDLPAPSQPVPRALALRTPVALIRDHATARVWLIAESGFAALADQVRRDLAVAPPTVVPDRCAQAVHEDAADEFLRGVDRIIDYIGAGDVFQVNLSRGWRARWPSAVPVAALYAALRESNPAPFCGFLQWRDLALVSSSPERLVAVANGVVQTRPIAGTRPRFFGDDDAARVAELIGHPKERAEHIMLIDLQRNDLGRVTVPGTVQVDALMEVESYAHVHHIVSNVRGQLRAGVSPVAVLRAVFPGGTITGCPKVRCMQIIAELEGAGRGFYTGALGYLGVDGRMDLNILIRSISVHAGQIEFRAGAGIVADSQAPRELEETRAKAQGLLRALSADSVGSWRREAQP